MPKYEFECNQCKEAFEATASIQEKESGGISCPKCRSKDLSQLFSGININSGKPAKGKSGGCCGGDGCCC